MALVNYMGDAPGTMSYQRQRSRQPLGFRRWQKPQGAMPGADDEIDVSGLPGDAQWFYQNQKRYKDGMKSLYNQYGGEMDWVMADPKYKQVASSQDMFAYNTQAIERNLTEAQARDVALRTYASGQQGSQYELKDVGGGNYMMKHWSQDENGNLYGVTKDEFLQGVVKNPNLALTPDGNPYIDAVNFDEGTGDMDKFNAMLNAFFSDRGTNSSEWDKLISEDYDNTQSMGYGVSELHSRGGMNANNYEQIKAATDYIKKYGLDENHEYFIRQEMFDAFHKNKAFKMPKMDENGEFVRDDNGQLILENKRLTWEDVNDPGRMALLEEFYFQDRVADYAEKLRAKKTASKKVDKFGYQNIDPQTGQPVRDESQYMFDNIVQGNGPEVSQTGVNNYEATGEYVNGEEIILEHDYKTTEYNHSNFGPYMKMAEENYVPEPGTTTIYDLVTDGKINIDGTWNKGFTTEELKSMKVVGMQNLQKKDLDQYYTDEFGMRRKQDGWIGNFKVLISEDASVVEGGKLEAFNGEDGTIEPIISGNLSEGENWAKRLFTWKDQKSAEGEYGITLPRDGYEIRREWMEIEIGVDLTEALHMVDMNNPNASRAKGADINITSSTGDAARQRRGAKSFISQDPEIDNQASIPK